MDAEYNPRRVDVIPFYNVVDMQFETIILHIDCVIFSFCCFYFSSSC